MYIRSMVFVLLGLLFVSCSSLSTGAKAMEVYEFKFRLPKECKVLGEVEVEASSMMDKDAAMRMAREKLQQKAYDTYQANTLHVKDVGTYFVGVSETAYAKGTAYNCPE